MLRTSSIILEKISSQNELENYANDHLKNEINHKSDIDPPLTLAMVNLCEPQIELKANTHNLASKGKRVLPSDVNPHRETFSEVQQKNIRYDLKYFKIQNEINRDAFQHDSCVLDSNIIMLTNDEITKKNFVECCKCKTNKNDTINECKIGVRSERTFIQQKSEINELCHKKRPNREVTGLRSLSVLNISAAAKQECPYAVGGTILEQERNHNADKNILAFEQGNCYKANIACISANGYARKAAAARDLNRIDNYEMDLSQKGELITHRKYPDSIYSSNTDLLTETDISHQREKDNKSKLKPWNKTDAIYKAITLSTNRELNSGDKIHLTPLSSCDNESLLTSGPWKTSKAHALHYCVKCNKRFATKTNLNRHVRIHTGENVHICNHCSKMYATHYELKRHQKNISSESHYRCDYCNLEFNATCTWKKHRKIHKWEQKRKQTKKLSATNSPQNDRACQRGRWLLECESQSKTQTNESYDREGKSKQNAHGKFIFGADRPYCCCYCQKRFSKRGGLTLHTKVHIADRPYYCNHCGRDFVCSSHLKTHKKSHSEHAAARRKHIIYVKINAGEKTHKCNHCSKAFFKSSNLKKHITMHAV